MDSNDSLDHKKLKGNINKFHGDVNNIKSVYLLKKIFNNSQKEKSFKILRYNKKY